MRKLKLRDVKKLDQIYPLRGWDLNLELSDHKANILSTALAVPGLECLGRSRSVRIEKIQARNS